MRTTKLKKALKKLIVDASEDLADGLLSPMQTEYDLTNVSIQQLSEFDYYPSMTINVDTGTSFQDQGVNSSITPRRLQARYDVTIEFYCPLGAYREDEDFLFEYETENLEIIIDRIVHLIANEPIIDDDFRLLNDFNKEMNRQITVTHQDYFDGELNINMKWVLIRFTIIDQCDGVE